MIESDKITTRTERITPKKAEQYLAMKKTNRPIDKAHVKALAKMMRDGTFHLTHQGIAFNCDGTLQDGQHRLLAIIESGMYVSMNVSRGLPNKAMDVIDTGKKRTIADALNINGLATDSRAVAIGRRMMDGSSLLKNGGHGSRLEIIRFIEKHSEAIEFAKRQPGNGAIFLHASLRAPIARAWYTANRKRLAEFMEVLSSGFATSDDDRAAILLRNYYMANRQVMGRHAGEFALYLKTEQMLSDFLNREPVTTVRKAKSELFPLPEEKINATK